MAAVVEEREVSRTYLPEMPEEGLDDPSLACFMIGDHGEMGILLWSALLQQRFDRRYVRHAAVQGPDGLTAVDSHQ